MIKQINYLVVHPEPRSQSVLIRLELLDDTQAGLQLESVRMDRARAKALLDQLEQALAELEEEAEWSAH